MRSPIDGLESDRDSSRNRAFVATHLSTLVFLGEVVLKFRRHVKFGFLDLSTIELRRKDCAREIELNQRLAPDVYLGVAEVSLAGQVIEPVVVMRQLPRDRSIEALLGVGGLRSEGLRSVARVLVEFHSFAIRSSNIDTDATAMSILGRWNDNFLETSTFSGSILDGDVDRRIQELVRKFIAGREELFAQRISSGEICDGHGDLQAADIFLLPDGPRILDCLEFDDHLRHLDVVDDLSFLLMDLDRLGAPDSSRQLRGYYEEFSGSHAPESLLDHYCAYHAYVRSMVACLRSDQDRDAIGEARRLQLHALRYLERSRVQLVIIGGLPGTGKSTISRLLTDRVDAVVLRSDEVRREIWQTESRSEDPTAYREDGYSPGMTSATYRTMLDRAEVMLRHGTSVILDASWISKEYRSQALALAEATASEFIELQCVLDESVAARRINARRRRGDDVSEATVDIARMMSSEMDVWPSAFNIDTSKSQRRSLETALIALGKSAPIMEAPGLHPEALAPSAGDESGVEAAYDRN